MPMSFCGKDLRDIYVPFDTPSCTLWLDAVSCFGRDHRMLGAISGMYRTVVVILASEVVVEADQPTQTDLVPCPHCGEMIKPIARKCRHCREYLDEELKAEHLMSIRASTTERFLTPVDRPTSAIAAGYLGLFSLLPLIGIVAIAVAIHALSDLRKHPELAGRGRAIFGLVMGILTTLLYGAGFVAAAMGY